MENRDGESRSNEEQKLRLRHRSSIRRRREKEKNNIAVVLFIDRTREDRSNQEKVPANTFALLFFHF